jgi:ERCC4-type nuclease
VIATVTIDRREQRELRFPEVMKWYGDRATTGQIVIVRTQTKQMPVGDYALKGFEETCIIERKGSIRELATNLLGDDWARAMDAFKRLADATAHPYLMVECTPADLRTRSRWVHEPERVVDALAALIEKLDLRLILCGRVTDVKQKRTVGELMLRLMLAHAYQRETDYGEVEDVIKKIGAGNPRGSG